MLPSIKSLHQLNGLPYFILKMPNNYDYYKEERTKLNLDYRGLLEHLKDKDSQYYYDNVLIDMEKTLNDFITEVSKSMARISGVDLPRDKRIEIGLTYIYGIGLTTSQKMLAEVGINPDTRVKDLSENDISKLRDYIEHHLKVEGDLRREVSLNIKRLVEIGCYRGVRHRRGLPVRGQNTKQNARTRKGPKRTVAGKKKATK